MKETKDLSILKLYESVISDSCFPGFEAGKTVA